MVAHALKAAPGTPGTVQVRDGKMSATDGLFMETKEVLGGFIASRRLDRDRAVRRKDQLADMISEEGRRG